MTMLKRMVGTVALLVAVGTASAAPTTVTFTDTFTPTPANPLITSTTPFLFSFDVTSTGFKNGFVAGSDLFTSGLLTIFVNDSDQKGSEVVSFIIGQTGATQVIDDKNISNGASNTSYPLTLVAALADLNDDGKLHISLTATSGDFNFVDATLTGTFTKGAIDPPAVPEPESIALLGLGLLGLAAARRKSAK